jgi:methionyl-tRNA formyltransferase
MENKKTFYMGSGDFSAIVLKKIYDNFDNLTIVTPINNKLPLVKVARELKLKLVGVKNKLDLENLLEKENPDINIVCDFGIIITKKTLDKHSPIVNIHPSILPKYRGCAPIISTILNNDKYAGVSLMKMEEGIDEGPVYKIKKIIMSKKEDIFSLSEKLSTIAANLIIKNINNIVSDKIKPLKQDHKKSICTNLISKEQGLLNINESAEAIERKIRAYKKWPGIFTYIKANNKKILIKITEADVAKKKNSKNIYISKDTMEIKTANNYLSIKKIQPEGKKEMSIKDFLCGYKNIELNN